MYVCMYIYIYIYIMYIYVCVYVYIYIYIDVCVSLCVCVRVYRVGTGARRLDAGGRPSPTTLAVLHVSITLVASWQARLFFLGRF